MSKEQKASAVRFSLGALAGITLTPILGIMLAIFEVDLISTL